MPPKAPANHPSYGDMIKAAISTLKERSGTSLPALKKYIEGNFNVPDNYNVVLKRVLKSMVSSGKLVKVKASFKLGEALKKAPKAKKPKAKKPAAKKPKKAAKKPAAKKPKAPKKPAAKKPKAKKPKAPKKK